MSTLDSRNAAISTIVELTRGIDEIGALMTFGDEPLAPSELKMTAIVREDGNVKTAYGMMNYCITSELQPSDSKGISRSEQSIIKRYTLDDVNLTMRVCAAEESGSPQWCRVLFDEDQLTDALGGRVDEDQLIDELGGEVDEDQFTDELGGEVDEDQLPDENTPAPAEDEEATQAQEQAPSEENPAEADDGISAVIIPTAAETSDDAAPNDLQAEEERYWAYVTAKLKAAQRAIASGAIIRANEIVSLLRHMLIELICVRNGITDNFEHSIDFIECEEKNMLMKTYPTNIDAISMAAALGAISELFDRLA